MWPPRAPSSQPRSGMVTGARAKGVCASSCPVKLGNSGVSLTLCKGSVLQPGVVRLPHLQCLPRPCGSSTSGLSGASAGSQWQEDSACGTAGNVEHEAGGCCWVGRGLCTAIAAPNPSLRCTCGKRSRVRGICAPQSYTWTRMDTLS